MVYIYIRMNKQHKVKGSSDLSPLIIFNKKYRIRVWNILKYENKYNMFG